MQLLVLDRNVWHYINANNFFRNSYTENAAGVAVDYIDCFSAEG